MKIVGYALLAAATAAGVWAVGVVLFQGHDAIRTTQFVPWGLWVALYVFFLGLSAGGYLVSSLAYVFRIQRFEPAAPMALLQALVGFLIGGFLVIIDLGHPERGYKVLTSLNPTSVMSWMAVLYTIYCIVLAGQFLLLLRPRGNWMRRLGMIGFPVALLLPLGVGTLFAVAKARPGWFSGLFPVVFLITAAASGAAFLTFLTSLRRADVARDLARLSIALVGFDLLLLASEILVTMYGNVPHESSAWRLTLFGPYWPVFWIGQVGLGFLAPLVLIAAPRIRSYAVAGLLIVVGTLAARITLVIPPQIEPVFPAMPEAYHHDRWTIGYLPGWIEWFGVVGAFAFAAWAFLIGWKMLPRKESA